MESGDFSGACASFEESLALEPAVGTQLNLGECYERLGRLASAFRAFDAGAHAADALGQGERARRAHTRAQRLLERLSTLTLVVPNQSAHLELRLDGLPLAREQWGVALPVDRGTHVVEARRQLGAPWRAQIVITREAERVSITIPEPSAARLSAPLPETKPRPASLQIPAGKAPMPTVRRLAVSLAAVGVLGLGAGTLLGVRAKDKWQQREAVCDDDDICEPSARRLTAEARSAATWSTVSFVAGGALATAGVALFFVRPRSRARAVLVPSLGSGLGLSVRVAFAGSRTR
jgi:hypothetical protein